MRRFVTSLVVSSALIAGSASASSVPVDRTPSVTGTVARVVASQRQVEVTLADGTLQRFEWNAETKISGTLMPGAAVTIRYTPGTDGKNLALQITVSRS